METRTYTERSNARRAARAFGVDPESVVQTEDGFTFSLPEPKKDDGLDIPEFCRISPEQRRATWENNPPKTSARASSTGAEIVAPKAAAKPKRADKAAGGNKNATLLKMLAGKGATVEALTTSLEWLPHTLRARISRLAKPKSKGGEGLKIERERKDGVTIYRIGA